jgi:2,3-bisphosphoglycerate-independent phosphoglycerate mutase
VKPMDKASEAILSLQPVSFRYKKEIDPKGIRQFGLVAEEVEKIDPDLVARDVEGKPFTVRYDEINAMLLNEFLKEHRKVEEQASINQQQQTTIAELKSEIRALTKRFEEQSAQIQKVNEQVQLNAHVPRLVVNEP